MITLYGRPEFTAKVLVEWLTDNHVGPTFIKPGSPWQNGYVESFNGKFRDECLNREWFYNRKDTQIMIEKWRHHYNHERPHSLLNDQPPAKVSDRKYVA